MNRVLVIALSAIGTMSIAAAFVVPTAEKTPVSLASQPATPRSDGDDRVLTLARSGSGQFNLRASVNGSEVEFMVDTGADIVALTVAEAESLGILPGDEQFQPNMQTASGVGYGAPVTLDEVEIAGQRLQGVEAVVVRDLATNLLGQSALRQLGSVELKGDRMVITPR